MKQIKTVSGYDDQIDRIRKATTKREQKKVQDNQTGYTAESYQKSRQLAKKGVKPFKLTSNGGRYEPVKAAPSLYLDINLDEKRKGRLGISPNDSPRVLAEQFAKVFLVTNH